MVHISQNVIEISTPTLPNEVVNKGYVDGYIASCDGFCLDIVQLRSDISLLVFGTVNVSYHTTKGDGGGGGFYWDSSNTTVDDGGYIIAVSGVSTGRWVRLLESNVVTPEMWGCPVGIDATIALNKALAWCDTNGGGKVQLGARVYASTSVNFSNYNFVELVGCGQSSVIKQIWFGSPGPTYGLIDMCGAQQCSLYNFAIDSMAWSSIGVILTRSDAVGSCNGNKLSKIWSLETSTWSIAPLVVIGAEETTFSDLRLYNATGTGNSQGCLFFGMNLAHLPITVTSLYAGSLMLGTQSTLDNTFFSCHFTCGVSAIAKIITLSGPAECRFVGGGFYSVDNNTACKCIVHMVATDAMFGSYNFDGLTFEAANTPVFYLENVGYSTVYYNSVRVRNCFKTSALGNWLTAPTNVLTRGWFFESNYGAGGFVLNADSDSTWDLAGLDGYNSSTVSVSVYAVGSYFKVKHGNITIPNGGLGCHIDYISGDPGWDGSDSHSVWRSTLGGNFGSHLQILESTKSPHADAVVDGYGLILHSDGIDWSPAGPISEESYPIFRNSNNKWVPLTTISATPATAISTGAKGTVGFDNDYLYICKNENDWGRVIVDSFGNTHLAIRTQQRNSTSSAVSLTSDPSAAVLAVTISDLESDGYYCGVVGARITINTTGTTANCGIIDIVVGVYITTDGSGVATVAFTGAINVDTSKLASAISTATGTIAASTGGFTVYATRVSGVVMSASVEANLVSITEIS